MENQESKMFISATIPDYLTDDKEGDSIYLYGDGVSSEIFIFHDKCWRFTVKDDHVKSSNAPKLADLYRALRKAYYEDSDSDIGGFLFLRQGDKWRLFIDGFEDDFEIDRQTIKIILGTIK